MVTTTGRNPQPDYEGIETSENRVLLLMKPQSRNPQPDYEGIESEQVGRTAEPMAWGNAKSDY